MTGDHQPVGLIGIGLLGSALAERLLTAGFDVVGFDLEPDRLSEFARLGGHAATSAADVAPRCGPIVLCLPADEISRAVVDEIRPSLRAGALLIDTTTGDPDEMAALGVRLATAGIDYIDATVGGSSEQVRRGEAIVMAGGTAGALERASGILQAFASRVFHVGPIGTGGRMKLVVNLVLGLNRVALAEGLGLARALGLPGETALEVLQAGPAWSRAMDVKGRKMLAADFTPEARLSQHLKDVRLILEAGGRTGAKLPLSQLHRELLERLEAAGYGSDDNSAIARAFP
jgi:3-hydroxyisobutyrate dehydrogenase-like beta-hydroxyacid dehydrogenase